MNGITHSSVGVAVGLLSYTEMINLHLMKGVSLYDLPVLVISGLLIGQAADLDTYNSSISRSNRPISFMIKLLSKHRGFLHSLFFTLLIGLVTNLYTKSLSWSIIISAIYLSHLIVDSWTKQGVKFFWPINKSFHTIPKVFIFKSSNSTMNWIVQAISTLITFIVVVLVVYTKLKTG